MALEDIFDSFMGLFNDAKQHAYKLSEK